MKSIVLLSAGLDSTVCLAQAVRESKVELCLTFDYGQRAAKQEIKHARALAEHYNVTHRVLKLDFFKHFQNSALISDNVQIPAPEKESLDCLPRARETAAAVWVPNRNGIFINIAAGFAETLKCQLVVTGFNAEEAAAFPDNSAEYVIAANEALSYSTANGVRVVSYTQRLNKTEIVQLGQRLGVPWQHVWSCYYGGEEMCGRCESCRRFYRGLEQANVIIK
ncbi:7-cyano-7-deazaguanine synthase [Desulfohalotomaculum tongense]|uniref:7-cyano-7-deazaguanine synthase QueC n=1 Tax=Desulforadius tongensis TaxID=1216062 RepID=UPI0019566335|nr:7-cyano-7-deazaguanine synthase QueC [Desulforadius tongensis]MBM7855287.1 7-cyano-7-deazaguanine synthase [Desulforadius tongensis]